MGKRVAVAAQQWAHDVDIHHNHGLHDSDDTKLFRRIHVICMKVAEDLIAEERQIQHNSILVDVEKAISAAEQAVHITPDDHVAKPGYLTDLGIFFKRRFEYSGAFIDIDKAISAQEQAIKLIPDENSAKPGYLNSLGSFFLNRFHLSGDLAHMNMAISAQENAVCLTPNSNIKKPGYLTILGNYFLNRFRHSGNLQDIDNGILAYEQATHLTPDGHGDRPGCLHNLGNSFSCRFKYTGDLTDSSAAMLHYCHAAQSTGSPLIRFLAALKWARLASRVNMLSAFQGYTVAFNLLPEISWLGQAINAKCGELTSFGEVASEAAAAAISVERYDAALEWLEQGHSIVWSQLCHLRTHDDGLWEVQPNLANELIRVSKAMDHANSCKVDTQDISTPSDQQLSMDQVTHIHRCLAEEWDMLVRAARKVPGFKDFLQPKKFVQLHSAACAGPVVVVNVHKNRCDALVLVTGSDEVMHIPLNNLSYGKAEKLHQSLNCLLSAGSTSNAQNTGHPMEVVAMTSADFPSILSDLWFYLVKPVLDGLAFKVRNKLLACFLN